MNRLASMLEVGDVRVDVPARDKASLFAGAGSILAREELADAAAMIAETLVARERLGSTALGHGVAIPHGRVKGLATARAAVLRLSKPLPFDAPDDEPTSLFVFLLVSERATQGDLDTLAEIAELLSDRSVREQLLEAPDARALHAAIAGWSPDRTAVVARKVR